MRITLPYKSIEEAKKAGFPTTIRGAPLTIEQINDLARYYDEAKEQSGVDNPMAIAYTRFYAKYKKVGNKWVVKESYKEKHKGSEEEMRSFVIRLSGIELTKKEEEPARSRVQLVRTGKFKHPFYGRLEFNEDVYRQFKKNFDDNVLGMDLAIDQEHRPEMGAAGWFKGIDYTPEAMSADIEWTKWGEELLRDKRYKYMSIDYDTVWENPETGKEYKYVLWGAALTNRPFIKGQPPINLSDFTLSELEEDGVKVSINLTADEGDKEDKGGEMDRYCLCLDCKSIIKMGVDEIEKCPSCGSEKLEEFETMSEPIIKLIWDKTLEELESDGAKLAAVPFSALPKAPEELPWSFTAADGNAIIDKGGMALYKKAHLWYDAANPDIKGSYKLPIAKLHNGTLKVFLRGVMAAGGALMGARGGVDIPAGDVAAVKANCAKYYHLFDRKAPWETETEKGGEEVMERIEVVKALGAEIQDEEKYISFLEKLTDEEFEAHKKEVEKLGEKAVIDAEGKISEKKVETEEPEKKEEKMEEIEQLRQRLTDTERRLTETEQQLRDSTKRIAELEQKDKEHKIDEMLLEHMKKGKLGAKERDSVKALLMSDDGEKRIELDDEKGKKVKVDLFTFYDRILGERMPIVRLDEITKQPVDESGKTEEEKRIEEDIKVGKKLAAEFEGRGVGEAKGKSKE